jgi:hypothetical protein
MEYRVRLSVEMSKQLKLIANGERLSPHGLVEKLVNRYIQRSQERKISLSPKMETWLKQVAEQIGISIPQLLNRAVMEYVTARKCEDKYSTLPANDVIRSIEISEEMYTQLQQVAQKSNISIPQLLDKMTTRYCQDSDAWD